MHRFAIIARGGCAEPFDAEGLRLLKRAGGGVMVITSARKPGEKRIALERTSACLGDILETRFLLRKRPI